MKHKQIPTGTRLFREVIILDDFVSGAHIQEYSRTEYEVPQRWHNCVTIRQPGDEHYITGLFEVTTVWKYSKKHNKLTGLEPEIFYNVGMTGPMTEKVERGDVLVNENGWICLSDAGRERLGIKTLKESKYGNSNK